ncbi:hypothetical protein [Alkaliphilus metalliredigens]|uniref:hypothetical protein n=1 Tax=Alkaliphilus metalliredigens TaxID=208226 RepID=UPI0018DE5191|nr:hypothetical protein [Alkaliphilus metalliredigens]
MFEEVNRTCDRISIIKDGRLVITDQTMNLEAQQGKVYTVIVKSSKDIECLESTGLDIWLNKISIFRYFNPAKIINGSVDILSTAISFFILRVILYGASIYIFNKRKLPL